MYAVIAAMTVSSAAFGAKRTAVTRLADTRAQYQRAFAAHRAALGEYGTVVTALRVAANEAKSGAASRKKPAAYAALAKAMNEKLAGIPETLRNGVRPMGEEPTSRLPFAKNLGRATPAALMAQAERLLALADALETPNTETVQTTRAQLGTAEKKYAQAIEETFKAQVQQLQSARAQLDKGKASAGNTLFALASAGMEVLAGQASYVKPNAVTGQFSGSFSEVGQGLFSWRRASGRSSGTTWNRTAPLPPVDYHISLLGPTGFAGEHYRTPLEAREAVLAAAIATQAIWALQKNAKTAPLAATLSPWLTHSTFEISSYGADGSKEVKVDLIQGARALSGVGAQSPANSLLDGVLTFVQRNTLQRL